MGKSLAAVSCSVALVSCMLLGSNAQGAEMKKPTTTQIDPFGLNTPDNRTDAEKAADMKKLDDLANKRKERFREMHDHLSALPFEKQMELRPFVYLGSVTVTVDAGGDLGQKAGLSAGELKSRIELRLRQAGLEVKSSASPYFPSPSLSFSVGLIEVTSANSAIYLIKSALIDATLEIQDRLIPPGEESFHVAAEVWTAERFGMTPIVNTRSTVKEILDSQMDEFLNRYLEAESEGLGWKSPRR